MVATNLENLEKSGNSTLVGEKSGKLWFACGVHCATVQGKTTAVAVFNSHKINIT